FENDRVRVLDVRLAPGAQSARHAHPDGVWVLLAPMTARFTDERGVAADAAFPAGAVWRDAETHAVENTGKTDLRAIAIELK
ncbi:MAG: cytoplasmic protein, partial [Dehalococcoidia bacterium]